MYISTICYLNKEKIITPLSFCMRNVPTNQCNVTGKSILVTIPYLKLNIAQFLSFTTLFFHDYNTIPHLLYMILSQFSYNSFTILSPYCPAKQILQPIYIPTSLICQFCLILHLFLYNLSLILLPYLHIALYSHYF